MRSTKALLPKNLSAQIERFVGVLENYNRKLPHPRSKKNYPFLLDFYKRYAIDQNARALEVSSSIYQKIKEIANKQFPAKTLWNLCIDGRVLAILAHGASARVGSSVRVPGGMLREFVRGKDGKLKLDPNSDFANLLKKALIDSENGILAEVFDSHIGCSARLAEEDLKGKYPQDSGLLADVSHKLQMANAAIAFTKDAFGDKKKLIVVLTSFDPHTGFLYMGLETHDAFLYVYKRGNAYTKELLQSLTEIGKIISTEQLVADDNIRLVFAKHAFTFNWKENYTKSAKLFWESIVSMKKQVLPAIEQKLKQIYPHLEKGDEMARVELEERAMLLLTNAFSGYLHNLNRKVKGKKTQEQMHPHYYPYGVHKEEGVKVGEGGYPPYSISMFTVFTFEEKNLPSNIQLATSLVRKNRKDGRVSDAFGYFADPIEFAQASVPLVVSEFVRAKLSNKEWQRLSSIDWRDIPENWDTISDDTFYTYLHHKGISHFEVALVINNLRRKLSVMVDMHSPISSRLIEQYAVALPTVASRNRRMHFVVPFVKLGFT